MAAGVAGSFSQALEQVMAGGHPVGIGRIAGQGVQHAVQDFAALLLEAGVRRVGSRSARVGKRANGGPRDAEKWRLWLNTHN